MTGGCGDCQCCCDWDCDGLAPPPASGREEGELHSEVVLPGE